MSCFFVTSSNLLISFGLQQVSSMWIAVEQLMHDGTWFEMRCCLCGDRDGFTCVWVTSLPLSVFSLFEHAKASQLYALSLC